MDTVLILAGAFLQWLKNFVETNPPVVLIVFAISLFANFIEIGNFFRERRRRHQEEVERLRLTQLVESYESVLQLAQDVVNDRTKLEQLRTEIKQQGELAEKVAQRGQALKLAAQKALIEKTLDYHLSVLKEAHEEINRLRHEHNDLDGLPDVPEAIRSAVNAEVDALVRKPYEFPRQFLFTSSLLVLLLLLLPSPVDLLVLPFIIRHFLLTFFDAVVLYPDHDFQRFVARWHSILVFMAVFGVWSSFFLSLEDIASRLGGEALGGPWWQLRALLNLLLVPVVLILSVRQWRQLKNEVKENHLPKLIDSKISNSRFGRFAP